MGKGELLVVQGDAEKGLETSRSSIWKWRTHMGKGGTVISME